MSNIELAFILKEFFSWRLVVSNAGDIPQPNSYQIPEINMGTQFVRKAAKNILHKQEASWRFILSLPLTSWRGELPRSQSTVLGPSLPVWLKERPIPSSR
jgi:hypothetical protein